MSLAFMIKAHSSQDCRRIRILSIKMGLAYAIMNMNNQVEHVHEHFDHFQYLSEMGGGGGGGGVAVYMVRDRAPTKIYIS